MNNYLSDIYYMFISKQYKFFLKGQYNLNIFAVRSNDTSTNEFNDYIFCCYRDEYNKWRIHQWECTTDPGLYYLNNPYRVDGTAILVPGQYRSAYGLGLHRGLYTALTQKYAKVKVYRDRDNDSQLDFTGVEEGFLGINIHKSGLESQAIGKWSAGCVVFRRAKDFEELIDLCKLSASMYGDKFTFTLFTERDFNLV